MTFMWIAFLFPIVWPFIAKQIWHTTITWTEMLISIVSVCILTSLCWYAGTKSLTYDTEIWSGQVYRKIRQEVSCEHSYDCNCVPVQSCSNNVCSTTTVCSTCYDHSYDVDWTVDTDIPGGDFNINRIDRRGITQPPRWTEVRKGQPVAVSKYYENYIKGAPESLFNVSVNLEQFAKLIPQYPKVYDYHRINRIIPMGVKIPKLSEYNTKLELMMRKIGPKKQANIIIIPVNTADQSYRYALENQWLGGKKNDIIVLLGSTNNTTFDWVDVISWSKKQIFNVTLRDDLKKINSLEDFDLILATIERNTNKLFVRKPMSEFEYLKSEIEPPFWAQMSIFILGVLISGIVTLVMHQREFKF